MYTIKYDNIIVNNAKNETESQYLWRGFEHVEHQRVKREKHAPKHSYDASSIKTDKLLSAVFRLFKAEKKK